MTFLDAVNNVLTRLRENTVISVVDSAYSRLIARLVNDAKEQVENSYAWNALQSDITVSTIAGTSTYSLTGSGQRFRLLNVIDDTTNTELKSKSLTEIKWLQRTNPLSGTPQYFAFNGIDTNGDTKVTFYPTPDAVVSVVFNSVVPQSTLVNDTDQLLVPEQPVVLGAYARAVAERGEDSGFSSSEAYGLYKDALSDAIAIESSRTYEDAAWSPN